MAGGELRGLCSAYALDVSRERAGTSGIAARLVRWAVARTPASYGLSGLNVSSNGSCLAGETTTGLALAGILLTARAPLRQLTRLAWLCCFAAGREQPQGPGGLPETFRPFRLPTNHLGSSTGSKVVSLESQLLLLRSCTRGTTELTSPRGKSSSLLARAVLAGPAPERGQSHISPSSPTYSLAPK